MSFQRIVSHFSQGLISLAPPFWGKRIVAALLCAVLLEVQEIEDALFDVREKRKLANASGAQLETLGALVHQPRYAFTDPEWKIAIRTRTRVNRSQGLRLDIVEVIRAALGQSVDFNISSAYPAGFRVFVRTNIVFAWDILQQMIQDSAGGGIWATLTIAGVADPPLRLSSVSVAGLGSRKLSSASLSVTGTGKLASVYQ